MLVCLVGGAWWFVIAVAGCGCGVMFGGHGRLDMFLRLCGDSGCVGCLILGVRRVLCGPAIVWFRESSGGEGEGGCVGVELRVRV